MNVAANGLVRRPLSADDATISDGIDRSPTIGDTWTPSESCNVAADATPVLRLSLLAFQYLRYKGSRHVKKIFAVLFSAAALTLAGTGVASASTITWNLSNVNFVTGNPVIDTATATGFFTVDSVTEAVTGFDITVAGGTVSLANGGLQDANHHYLSVTLGGTDKLAFQSASVVEFCTSNCFGSQINLTLGLSGPLTSGGGTILLNSSTLDCPRCGTLAAGSGAKITTNTVGIEAVPEPGTLLLFGTGIAIAGARLRKRRV
jgi:hypothetical protein